MRVRGNLFRLGFGEEEVMFMVRVYDPACEVGSGFWVWGLGFGVWGLGFGVWCLGSVVWDLGLRVEGVRFERSAAPRKKSACARQRVGLGGWEFADSRE